MPIVKNPRLRQIIIDNLLRSVRRRTAEEIREEVEVQMGTKVSIETIYGDLRTIKDENQLDGQELIVKDKNSKLYYQDKNFSIQDAPLSDEDMEMLDLASMIFRTFKSSPLLEKFESAIDKILTRSTLNKINGREEMNYIQPDLSAGDSGYQWIEQLFKSIVGKSTIELTYEKYGEKPEKKIISPYILKEFRNHWYLVGYDNLKSSTRVYALDKIKGIENSTEIYSEDPLFDHKMFFNYSFGVYHNNNQKPEKIKLEFYDPYINQVINHPLKSNQKHTLNTEKKVLYVELELYIGPELVRELLGFGTAVKIISPANLAKQIKEIGTKMAELY